MLITLFALTSGLAAQSGAPLKLLQRIPMPGVAGRIDHLSIDLKGHRLFVSALGNNTVEVIDLASGKVVHTIRGMREPQGVFYVPSSDKLFVANGGTGIVKVLDGRTYKLLATVRFPSDADDIRYDRANQRVFVGYGTGGIGVLDAMTGKALGTIKLRGHAEAFEVESGGARIYVNVPTAEEIAVADWNSRSVIERWPMRRYRDNFPMGFDQAHHRLFVACRRPAVLLVLDPQSGRILAHLPVTRDADDLYYDASNHRIYLSGGQGEITVVGQTDADHYRLLANIPTAPGARTSLLVPQLKRFFLAVPSRGAHAAEIRVYAVNQ